MENYSIKISVIMPVYNSGEYLKTAVESILSQSLREIELILVDDGSTDGSSERCDEFATSDERVKVIHQKNAGICTARNVALRIAKGEYLAFSDHDDEYLPGLLEDSLNFALENHLDIVKYGHNVVKIRGRKLIESRAVHFETKEYYKECVGDNYIKLFLQGALTCVWDGIYRRHFIISKNIQFDTFFTSGGEDVDFMGKIISCQPNLGTLSKVFYNHYIRLGFSTSTKFNENKILSSLSFPRRFFQYLTPYDFRKIVDDNSLLYVKLLMSETVGNAINILNSSQCPYDFKKKRELLDSIYVDKYIDHSFFKCSNYDLLKNSFSYGILYFLFKRRMYHFCFALYTIRSISGKF